MKYLILVPDGAADEPIEALENRTPLEVAEMPNINELARRGTVGMVRTIPPGVAPGSDAANLSVMGYDPAVYLTGRSPLEAASIGIDMSDTDIAFRTNIITLTCDGKNPPKGDEAYEDLIITDHSSGDISTEEADQLINAINEAFADDKVQFYTGVSYRHCMIVKNGSIDYDLTPPHDVLGEKAGDHLPKEGLDGGDPAFIEDMMRRSYEVLKDHPVNKARVAEGKNPANTIWIWGQGTKPTLSSFYDKYGITGTAISAVDLIKGIALCAGLDSVDVEGATGTLDTNFTGKAKAAIREFRNGKDFIYMHLEAPDECSHQGDMEGKIKSLNIIDTRVLQPIIEAFREDGEDYRILIVPDHRTPLSIRTHSSAPVPFVLYDSTNEEQYDETRSFTEKSGEKGMYFDSGHELADYFFTK
ncbi:MAG: cofactor-independent phosphoglycerate mutase [Lentihominibacter sp.]